MRGIKNVSANCYMNTALQTLLNVGWYNDHIVRLYLENPADHDNDMLKLYLRALVDYHNNKQGPMSIG